jgi:hypothetical protein
LHYCYIPFSVAEALQGTFCLREKRRMASMSTQIVGTGSYLIVNCFPVSALPVASISGCPIAREDMSAIKHLYCVTLAKSIVQVDC